MVDLPNYKISWWIFPSFFFVCLPMFTRPGMCWTGPPGPQFWYTNPVGSPDAPDSVRSTLAALQQNEVIYKWPGQVHGSYIYSSSRLYGSYISCYIYIVHGDNPLVNIPKKNDGKIHHAFSMGKSTISTGPCSIANCLFTRGYRGETTMIW